MVLVIYYCVMNYPNLDLIVTVYARGAAGGEWEGSSSGRGCMYTES